MTLLRHFDEKIFYKKVTHKKVLEEENVNQVLFLLFIFRVRGKLREEEETMRVNLMILPGKMIRNLIGQDPIRT